MSVTVKLSYLRIAARKVRLVADSIRGKTVSEADNILEFTRKKAARPLQKLLNSAIATAENDFQKDRSNLYISKIVVNEGPTLKRFRFRGGGRIYEILKRTSHVVLGLDEIKPMPVTKKPEKEAKKKKRVKPGLGKPPVKEPEPKEKIGGKEPKRPGPKPRIRIPKSKLRKEVKKIFRRKAF